MGGKGKGKKREGGKATSIVRVRGPESIIRQHGQTLWITNLPTLKWLDVIISKFLLATLFYGCEWRGGKYMHLCGVYE